ncbi:MAG: DM13 domain-containing protein [Elainella sp.]
MPSPASDRPAIVTPAPSSNPSALADAMQPGNRLAKTGTLMSGEHPTQGTVRLVTENNQSWIELGPDFATSELGPDLVVILHRSADVLGSTQPPAYPINEGDYVVIAPLQAFNGAQRYAIPANVNLADYQSAGIWCRRFNAMFGSATLRA